MKASIIAIVLSLLASTTFAAGTGESAAANTEVDDFPSRPITIIVPVAAGGGLDTTARKLASLSQEYLGVPVAVVNRTGGAGSIGVTEAARAAADGYTVLITDIGTLSTVPATQSVAYSVDSFQGVCGLNVNQVIIAVNSASPYKTVQDLVQSGTRIRYSTIGTGGIAHVAMVSLCEQAGIEATNVPFPSAAEAVVAVMGNHVDAAISHPNLVQAGLADGSIRVIGAFTESRLATMPNVPTVKEAGYDITSITYNLILVPKGVPENRLAKLRDGFNAMLKSPEMVENFANRKLEFFLVDGETLMATARKDAAKMGEMLKKMGIAN